MEYLYSSYVLSYQLPHVKSSVWKDNAFGSGSTSTRPLVEHLQPMLLQAFSFPGEIYRFFRRWKKETARMQAKDRLDMRKDFGGNSLRADSEEMSGARGGKESCMSLGKRRPEILPII
jgi:hypothetical protein